MKDDEVITNDEILVYLLGDGKNEGTLAVVDGFLKMPKQAQGLILSYCFNDISRPYFKGILGWNLEAIIKHGCNSPIEYTYAVALCFAYSFRADDMWADKDEHEYAKFAGFEIFPQYEIDIDENTYFADFLLSIDYEGSEIEGGQQWQGIVIECDGFDYHHATKEQVNHDNERELAIKKAGYDVLRFSGSQIYNDPFKCANDTIDYIIAEMNRRCVSEGTDG